mgnify:CR=1 FL=1
MTNSTERLKQPQGTGLIFTLGISASRAFLGATLFLTTRDDAQVAKQFQTGREAFTRAGSTARSAFFCGRGTAACHTGGGMSCLSAGRRLRP